jgi:lipid II:glycine glycyltransferase (peptidoglycan interpeptide bridge formation enzyme)
MNIELQIAGNEELKKWDSLIEVSPYGTIFHTLNWLKIAEKHTNSKLYPLIGLKGEEVIGVFPVFYKKKGPFKMVFSPPPKVGIPYMGPVLLGYEKLKQEKKESLIINFFKGVDNFIQNNFKPEYIHFKLPPGLIDCRPFKWLGYQVEPMYGYMLDISVGLSDLESNFSMQARRNIKKAKKDGMNIELGSKEELLVLYEWLYDRYKEQKIKIPISKDYLIAVFDKYFPKNLKVFIIRYQEDIISGGIKLCCKDRIIDWVGQPKTTVRTSNDFLHWGVMKWGLEHKLKYYEILGANTQSICQFKSKFSPSLDIYFEIKKATLSGIVAEKLYKKISSKKRK